jgi:hypothetical protein
MPYVDPLSSSQSPRAQDIEALDGRRIQPGAIGQGIFGSISGKFLTDRVEFIVGRKNVISVLNYPQLYRRYRKVRHVMKRQKPPKSFIT